MKTLIYQTKSNDFLNFFIKWIPCLSQTINSNYKVFLSRIKTPVQSYNFIKQYNKIQKT